MSHLSFCNVCGRETDHEEAYKSKRDIKAGRTVVFALVCNGCHEPSLKREYHVQLKGIATTDRYVLEQVEFIPPRLWHQQPSWFPQLAEVEPSLHELLEEVYSAANEQQARLLAMGVRTVLDKLMTKVVGDHGYFSEKLKKMVEVGEISSNDKELLEIIIDAGSATTHRAFNPPKDLLQEMIGVMESLVRKHYLTGPMLKAYKERIPPRPERPKTTTLAFSQTTKSSLPAPPKVTEITTSDEKSNSSK